MKSFFISKWPTIILLNSRELELGRALFHFVQEVGDHAGALVFFPWAHAMFVFGVKCGVQEN